MAAKFQVETRRLDCTLIASEQAFALVAPKQADRAPVALTLPDERDIPVVPMRTAQAMKTLLAQAPAG